MNRRKNADTRRANHRPVRRRRPDKSVARQEKQRRRVLSAQDTIPYREMAKDGICRVHDNLYSKTIRFFDLNYQLAQAEDKDAIFEGWCEFLNYFDFTIHVQLSFVNHHSATLEFDHSIQIKPQYDQFDDLRQEYSNMLREQLEKGNNGLVRTKYITFAIEADSIRVARPKLERIEADILNNFKVLGVVAYPLNGVERLRLMYEFFNPDSQTPFDFSYDMVLKSGMSTKDFIAPTSFRFRKARDFSMGDRLGAASYLQIIAPELSDRMLADFLDMDRDIMINMHIQSIEQSEAIKMVKSKVSDIQKMKIEEQKKAVRSGYDMDIIPSDLNTYSGEAQRLLEDLQSRNERLFLVTIVFLNTERSRRELDLALLQTAGIAQKYNCALRRLDYMQETGMVASLPLGWNPVPIKRALTTTATAVFIPFTTQELFMPGSFDRVARANMTDEELILYNALNRTYGNRPYLFNLSSLSDGAGIQYKIPPEALSDEKFMNMLREAEKYLGMEYVWGGKSPRSGFDCSGFVCWVINHCGNGWDVGSKRAKDLCRMCIYVTPEEARPGDLIFFEKTYDTDGASHVGIYVGNNTMIHCGNPIKYGRIDTRYFKQHFLCFGRLPFYDN